jgi:protein-tyrosine-phosphatase
MDRDARREASGVNVGGVGGRERILVVCYGNICRSPLAESMLKQALRDARLDRRYVVRSAGVGAQPGTAAARGTLAAAESRGLDLLGHRARRLTPEMIREADVLIALDEVVEAEIAILAGDVPMTVWPVDDPYGGPPEGYERAADEIAAHVKRFVDTLRAQSPVR